MREELLSNVGAQDLNTRGYQLTDREDIEFNCQNSQLDSVFRPGIDTPFSPTIFDDLSLEGSVENPIVLEERKTRRIQLQEQQEPCLSIQTNPPFTEKSCFWSKNRKGTDYVDRSLFQ